METKPESENSDEISLIGAFELKAEGNIREEARAKKQRLSMERDDLRKKMLTAKTLASRTELNKELTNLEKQLASCEAEIETPDVELSI